MPELHNPCSHKHLEDCHSDLESRDEALRTFRDLVKTSFDPREVEKWVRASPIRQDLFDDMAVGKIRWPRSLGRPDAPNLFDGFVIRTKTWADIWHVGLDGSIVVDLLGWIPGIPSDLRDGFSEPDHYSVRYLFHASVDNDNQVEVQFSDLPWHHPGRSVHFPRHYMSWHGYQFFSNGTFITLPDITVDGRPFFHP
jgi:hypothetical protein